MNAINLLNPDGTPSMVWQCAKCKRPDTDAGFASRCCTCRTCGCELPRDQYECKACTEKRLAKDRDKRWANTLESFAKAEKIEVNVNDTSALDEGVFSADGDNFYWSVEDYLDKLDGEPPSEFLWCSIPLPFKPSVDHMIENALDEHHEDAADQITKEEMKRLEDFVKEWASVQPLGSVEPDYTRAIVLVGVQEK